MKFKTYNLNRAIYLIITLAFVAIAVSCSAPTQQLQEDTAETSTVSQELPENNEVQTEENNSESIQRDSMSDVQEIDEIVLVKTAQIENGEHSVSAIINFFSDNTLVLENFNYDGKGPDVYVAIGNKADGGEFEKTKLVTEKLVKQYEAETITIQVEEGELFNAVSVYCDYYADDFGSAVLQEVQ